MESVQKVALHGKSSSIRFITALAAYYVFMGICAIVINITDYTYYNAVGYECVVIFSVLMILIWSMVFCCARRGRYRTMRLVLGLWTVYILAWVYIIILDFKDSLGYYCVDRRCANSFWVIMATSNKLPIDNAVDYYDHVVHGRPDAYDFNAFTVQTPSPPRVAKFRTRLGWLIDDFTKYLLKVVNFLILLGFFMISWIYLLRSIKDIKARILCSHCYNCNTSTQETYCSSIGCQN